MASSIELSSHEFYLGLIDSFVNDEDYWLNNHNLNTKIHEKYNLQLLSFLLSYYYEDDAILELSQTQLYIRSTGQTITVNQSFINLVSLYYRKVLDSTSFDKLVFIHPTLDTIACISLVPTKFLSKMRDKYRLHYGGSRQTVINENISIKYLWDELKLKPHRSY